MNILLKDLIKEIDDQQDPLKTQIYLDMDGVLVDIDKGFKKISGGYAVRDYKNNPEFGGNEKAARNKFFKLVNRTPQFWADLEPMPDAMTLWNFIKRKFVDPKPIILSAGQGTTLQLGKTQWVHKHLGADVPLTLAPSGAKKFEHIIPQENTRQVLIDDTQKNVDNWNNPALHRFAILHKNAAETIRLLNDITK